MCLEISKDDKTIFVGGSTDMNVHGGNSTIAAIQFNQYLVHLDSKVIGNGSEFAHSIRTKNVFELKRFDSRKYMSQIDQGVDVLFAACFKSLVIVEWRDCFKKFVQLKVISNVHSAEIFDFVICNRNIDDEEREVIYTVCANDEYIGQF